MAANLWLGELRRLRRSNKRVDTCGFYPLDSRFPLFVSLAKIGERRPLRKRGTAEDFYYRTGAQCAPISLPLRSVGYFAATHTVYSPQARHDSAAQLAGLVATHGTCGLHLSTDCIVGCDDSAHRIK